MTDLIKINKTILDNETQDSVNARELHEFLESKQEFANWIKGRIQKYGFKEGIDFLSFDNIIKRTKGATTVKEYELTIEMAKELSMVENNDKGRQARLYFIECESILKKAHKIVTEQLPIEIEERTIKAISGSTRYLADLFNLDNVASQAYAKSQLLKQGVNLPELPDLKINNPDEDFFEKKEMIYESIRGATGKGSNPIRKRIRETLKSMQLNEKYAIKEILTVGSGKQVTNYRYRKCALDRLCELMPELERID